MGLFRRRDEETLNEQLLREAVLDRPPQPGQAPPTPSVSFDPLAGTYAALPAAQPSFHPDAIRPSDHDVVVTATAPEIAGNAVEFVTLPDGDVLVDEEQGDADLSPLADAVEQHLGPPYRATGRRQDGDLWAVAARSIAVLRFACELGDELQLVSRGGAPALEVDSVPTATRIPELQRAGEALGRDYVVDASRLEGDLWEVRAAAL